ncbi:MAG: HAD-IA family hydrolase [Bacteroidota bacterium]
MNRHSKHRKIALLDLGGVVFQSTGTSSQKIHWPVISTLNAKYGHQWNIGKNVFPDFLATYNKMTDQSLSGEEFLKEIWDTLEMNRELVELIRKEHDIVIVSDNYRENITYISQRFSFEEWAIHQFYSFDFQLEKSNPDFFRKVLARLPACSPVDMLLIDDSLENIESASMLGIAGIQYKSNSQVNRQLYTY